MDDVPNDSIKGDRALSSGDQDRLGFREVAKRVATSLVDRASEDGFVIGLEGAWGSGKSSLLFLIEEELSKLPEDRKSVVINFRPWLIGNRDALIKGLFGELSGQLDLVALKDGDATPVSIRKAKEVGELLRKFMNGLSKFGSSVEYVGEVAESSILKNIGKIIKIGGDVSQLKPSAPKLSELKGRLEKSIRELGYRFIITIDDVDRIEPLEVIEILRLVRSVVDLPNIIYLLCYDSEILAHSVKKATGVKDGQSYLEKIVQLTVMVPKPEIFQLRQWFSDELHKIASVKNDDELSRLKAVVNYEGARQLQTPRAVVRALDAVRFFWPPLREMGADLADLVWIQLIKIGNPVLYRWIEDYCATMSNVSIGVAHVGEAEINKTQSALFRAVEDKYFNDLHYRYFFSENLPGIKVEHSENDSLKIFVPVDEKSLIEFIKAGRLASPDHYRYYFALARPTHTLAKDEYAAVWDAAEANAEQVGSLLLRFHDDKLVESLTKADFLLERIKDETYKILTPIQCENFLIAFSQVMDEAFEKHSFTLLWINSLWDRAEGLIRLLLSRVEEGRRENVIAKMFREGAAIGWLTSLFRRETFAHGRYGERPRPEREWLFKNEELDQITAFMLDRYRAMTVKEVLGSPNPVSLLFAWRQGGDELGPRRLVQNNIVSDEGLVETLECLVSPVESSDRGVYYVLKKSELSNFFDFEDAMRRLKEISDSNALKNRADFLIRAFNDSREV